MTIDESSIMPLDSEYQQKQREYQNLANAPSSTAPYEEIPETDNTTSIPYERYVPMSSVKEEKKFVPRFIPIKQFPATYQQYVASGIDKDSLFSVEFTSLNEESEINIVPPTTEALESINTNKNPFKNIVPFDENRVLLDSQYFDCNYILMQVGLKVINSSLLCIQPKRHIEISCKWSIKQKLVWYNANHEEGES